MSFDLMAAAAAGTGFIQGQDQAQQMAWQRQQMEQNAQATRMSLLMNQMKLQDEQKNAGFRDQESAYARQLADDPDTKDLPIDQKMDLMANSALRSGDLVRANELAVNATNFRRSQVDQERMQQLTASRVMESQQKLHNWMGSELAAAAEGGEDSFNQAKAMALASGEGTPQDQQNLANLRWDPDLARRLRLGAMNARQQAQTLNDTRRTDADVANKERIARDSRLRLDMQQQRLDIAKEEEERKQKAGGAAKAPTKEEMKQASAFLKDVDLSPQDSYAVTRSIVDIANQWKRVNPNLTMAQAMQKAADEVKRTDIRMQETPSKIPGFSPTKTTEYKMQGVTQDNPISYAGDKESLIPGRYYRLAQGVYQFNGMKFVQAQ